jgi:tRNA pseudouridine65 synthase
MRPLHLLEQTDDYVVVAKPAGLLVHRTKLAADRVAVTTLLKKQLDFPVWAAHRIDRGTSGCLVFGRTKPFLPLFMEGLRGPDATKCYLALVRGQLKNEERIVVDNPVKIRAGEYKDALTEVQVLASCAEPRCSVVLAWPRTGRNHQVRRHVRDIHHPVLLDGKHGDSRLNPEWKARGLRRLGLHCWSLRVPVGDSVIDVTCPLAPELLFVLKRLPLWDELVEKRPDIVAVPPIELNCRDPWWGRHGWVDAESVTPTS